MRAKIDEPTCKTCKHFIQHYYKRENSFSDVNCGHCIYPRIKRREPLSAICEHYESGIACL